MAKGNKFLILTVILVVAVFAFLLLLYDRPPESDVPQGATPSTPGGPVIQECEFNLTCFEGAISGGCKVAKFILPDPSNETAVLDGAITGQVLGKCQIRIESPDTGESMDCLVDASSFSSIGSLAGLKSACSGELLARITG